MHNNIVRKRIGVKGVFRLLLLLLVCGFVFLAGTPLVVDYIASRKVAPVLAEISGQPSMVQVEKLTRWMVDRFVIGDKPRWQTYLYHWENKAIPRVFRMNVGALDVLWPQGHCSCVAKAMVFIFSKAGFEAVQHDMVSARNYGHSAVSVHVANGWRFIDPHMGIFFRENNEIMSLERMLAVRAAGTEPQDIAVPLKADPEFFYYESGTEIFHARQGEMMDVEFTLPIPAHERMFGRIDGSSADTARDMRNEIPPYLWIFGRRYIKNMQYRMNLPEDWDKGARIVFSLVREPSPGNMPASNVAPVIEGRNVVYDLAPGERSLTLDVSTMKWEVGLQGVRVPWIDVDSFSVLPLQ